MDDIDALIAFFEARRGQMYGFRWKDWSDFKSCKPSLSVSATDQIIGTGDGVQAEFGLSKMYSSGDASYARQIAKPVDGSVKVALDGVEQVAGDDFVVDPATGIVTVFAEPLAGVSVTAGFEFDVPVRFDTDRIHTSAATFQAGEVPDVPVVEVRV